MREIKFRYWNTITNQMVNNPEMPYKKGWTIKQLFEDRGWIWEQYTGLKDFNDKEYYIGDIGEFDNGDRFVLKMEDWLEVYVAWIGEPECEDQARDLYRIERAKIIGNIHQNPDLL